MLVTGGARGLGAAIAHAAVSAGYRVGTVDVVAHGASTGTGSNGSAGIESFVTSVSDEPVTMRLDARGAGPAWSSTSHR